MRKLSNIPEPELHYPRGKRGRNIPKILPVPGNGIPVVFRLQFAEGLHGEHHLSIRDIDVRRRYVIIQCFGVHGAWRVELNDPRLKWSRRQWTWGLKMINGV